VLQKKLRFFIILFFGVQLCYASNLLDIPSSGFFGVQKQSVQENGIVFEVDAPPAIVWRTFGSFSNYPRWVEGITKATAYAPTARTEDRGNNNFIELHSESLLGAYRAFVVYNLPAKNRNWATWKLDPKQSSDLKSLSGLIEINPAPGSKNKTIVSFSLEVGFFKFFPEFLLRPYRDNGYINFASWVRREAYGLWHQK